MKFHSRVKSFVIVIPFIVIIIPPVRIIGIYAYFYRPFVKSIAIGQSKVKAICPIDIFIAILLTPIMFTAT